MDKHESNHTDAKARIDEIRKRVKECAYRIPVYDEDGNRTDLFLNVEPDADPDADVHFLLAELDEANGLIDVGIQQLMQAMRERDQAVRDIPHTCATCSKRKGWETCKEASFIEDGATCSNWQWCGLEADYA